MFHDHDRSLKNFYAGSQQALACAQGRSQTFSFGGATGGASFATRGAVNGLCLIALNIFNAVA